MKGFFAMCKADMLSQCKVTGVTEVIPSSLRSLTSQHTSSAAWAIALYSASKENLEVLMPIFFYYQLIG